MTPPAWLICIGSFSRDQYQELRRQEFPTIVLDSAESLPEELPERLVGDIDLQRDGAGFCFVSRKHVYLFSEDRDVLWYQYNDSRQDGFRGIEELSPRFPNLRLLSQKTVQASRFDRLMEEWMQQDPRLADGFVGEGGAIWLQTPQPRSVIMGMGDWFDRCADIYWTRPGALKLSSDQLDDRWGLSAEEGCFSLATELCVVPGTTYEALHWHLDRQRLLEDRSRHQTERIATLADDLKRLEDRLAHWRCVADELAGERDRLTAEVDDLSSQLLARDQEIQNWKEVCEVKQGQCVALTRERDKSRGDSTRLSGEVERLTGCVERLADQCGELQQALDGVRQKKHHLESNVADLLTLARS